MAKEAERLLADTGWLPEPLRAPEVDPSNLDAEPGTEPLPAFLADAEEAVTDDPAVDPEESEPHTVAAE